MASISDMKSTANLTLVMGDLRTYREDPDSVVAIATKQYKLVDEEKIKSIRVHKTCGTPVMIRQNCPHCETQINAPVKGTSSRPNKKLTHCPELICGEKIEGNVQERFYCAHEKCRGYQKPESVIEAIFTGDLKQADLVMVTDTDREELDKLRLSTPGDTEKKKGGERFLVYVGVIPKTVPLDPARVQETRLITGSEPGDMIFMRELRAELEEVGGRMVVHAVTAHIEEMTGKSEHVAEIMPNPSGPGLVIVNLHPDSAMREFDEFEPEGQDLELRESIGAVLGATPKIRERQDPRYTDTPLRHGIKEFRETANEDGKGFKATFIDITGAAKAAFVRLRTSVHNMNARLKQALEATTRS